MDLHPLILDCLDYSPGSSGSRTAEGYSVYRRIFKATSFLGMELNLPLPDSLD